jgi:hypothetical protein
MKSAIFILLIISPLFGCSTENGKEEFSELALAKSADDIAISANKGSEIAIFPVLKASDSSALSAEEIKALLGDKEIAAKLARKMSDDMDYWVRVAIENGDYRLSHSYALSLMGDDAKNCYRAMYFANKSVEYASESTKEIVKLTPKYLEVLMEETRFECGCPQKIPGKKLVCKNGIRTFEKQNP